MKTLDQLRGHLKAQPDDANGALKIVQSLISDTMKQSLLETLPGFNAETCVYAGHISDASRWVAENRDPGISIKDSDMKEAHTLNTAVERMCTGPRPQRSHYVRRPTSDYTIASESMYDPAGAVGGAYPAGAAGGIYPAGCPTYDSSYPVASEGMYDPAGISKLPRKVIRSNGSNGSNWK
jgi:hypothetical protein